MKKGIVTVCFLLGAACTAGAVLATRPAPDDAAEHRAESSASPAAAEPPAQAESASDRASRWEAVVLARPLFNPDRRPIGQAAAPGEDTRLPRLSGILITPNGRSAIFAPAGGGKPAVVPEGGSLGSYVVRTISSGEVVLAGPDGNHSLNPTLDHVLPAGRSVPPMVIGQDAAKAMPPTETTP